MYNSNHSRPIESFHSFYMNVNLSICTLPKYFFMNSLIFDKAQPQNY